MKVLLFILLLNHAYSQNKVYDNFLMVCEKRDTIETINQLPKYLQCNLFEWIMINDPDSIRLQGSYANGQYHNEYSTNEFLELKRQARQSISKPIKVRSDLDIFNYPTLSNYNQYKEIDIMITDFKDGPILYRRGDNVVDEYITRCK